MQKAYSNPVVKRNSFAKRLSRDISKNRYKYILVLPVLIWYILFCYKPMYGIIIAFKEYTPALGIMGSKWVGFKHFESFFTGIYFKRLLLNTLMLSGLNILISFPAPIILAIFLNEIRNQKFKATVQTISYGPYFISMVVICSMVTEFCSLDGIVTQIYELFTGERIPLLQQEEFFRTIYIVSDLWQMVGFNSVIYFAALCSINEELFEAAELDGAGRIRKIIHVSIPGIMPTIIIMFIMKIGQIMSLGADKVILLYNPLTYETADIISSYVYRKGLQEFNWSFSTAVGLFNNIVNIICLVTVNAISAKISETSLW